MINSQSGQLQLEDGQIIYPFMSLSSLEGMKLGQLQECKDLRNDWIVYNVNNIKVDNHHFTISFLLEHKKVKGLSLVFQEQAFEAKGGGWSSWSEQAELDKLEHFKTWLQAELGEKRHFDWGVVDATYNQKSGASSINIRYKNFHT